MTTIGVVASAYYWRTEIEAWWSDDETRPDGTAVVRLPTATNEPVEPSPSPSSTIQAEPTLDEALTGQASAAFHELWTRYDGDVAAGIVTRVWFWGPNPTTDVIAESYKESHDGMRLVQYYDKGRMEVALTAETISETPNVTSGLLPLEMITGRLQIGDDDFEIREPASISIAGDQDDDTGVTYQSLDKVLDAVHLAPGSVILQRIDRSGTVSEDNSMSTHGIAVASVYDETDHSVASPFEALGFEDLTWRGLPITEPYWIFVKVNGVYRDVLLQCFERRCLTYTPDFPELWRTEACNVGWHYYSWRYVDNN